MRTLCLLLAPVALAAACSELPPERFTFLDRLRVLGVRAEPLSLNAEVEGALSVLAFDPDGVRTEETSWSWCPYKTLSRDLYQCPVQRPRYIEMLRQGAQRFELELGDEFFERLPPFDLGVGASVTWQHTYDEGALTALCFLTLLATLDADRSLQEHLHDFPCEVGFELDIIAEVEASSGASLRARKSAFWGPGALDAPMRNPELLPLERWVRGAWVEEPAGELVVQADAPLQWRLRIPIDSLDPYLQDFDPDRPDPDPRLEGVFALWYTTLDGFAEEVTPFAFDPEQPDVVFAQNTFSLEGEAGRVALEEACPDVGEVCRVQLAVVIQDEQAGISWRVRTLEVER
ncbi:MAG: hypothetical protein AAGI01_07535 [Myxococcota bacterium]